jgi:hypothetical protein
VKTIADALGVARSVAQPRKPPPETAQSRRRSMSRQPFPVLGRRHPFERVDTSPSDAIQDSSVSFSMKLPDPKSPTRIFSEERHPSSDILKMSQSHKMVKKHNFILLVSAKESP